MNNLKVCCAGQQPWNVWERGFFRWGALRRLPNLHRVKSEVKKEHGLWGAKGSGDVSRKRNCEWRGSEVGKSLECSHRVRRLVKWGASFLWSWSRKKRPDFLEPCKRREANETERSICPGHLSITLIVWKRGLGSRGNGRRCRTENGRTVRRPLRSSRWERRVSLTMQEKQRWRRLGRSRCVLNIVQMGLLVDLMCRMRSKKRWRVMPESLTRQTRYAAFPVMGRHGNKTCLQLKRWHLKPWEWMSSSKREYEKKDSCAAHHLEGRAMRNSQQWRLGWAAVHKREEKKINGKAETDECFNEEVINSQKLLRVQ